MKHSTISTIPSVKLCATASETLIKRFSILLFYVILMKIMRQTPFPLHFCEKFNSITIFLSCACLTTQHHSSWRPSSNYSILPTNSLDLNALRSMVFKKIIKILCSVPVTAMENVFYLILM